MGEDAGAEEVGQRGEVASERDGGVGGRADDVTGRLPVGEYRGADRAEGVEHLGRRGSRARDRGGRRGLGVGVGVGGGGGVRGALGGQELRPQRVDELGRAHPKAEDGSRARRQRVRRAEGRQPNVGGRRAKRVEEGGEHV